MARETDPVRVDSKKRVTIIVAAHKKYRMPEDPMYLPLYIGAATGRRQDPGYQRDDEGENISAKNPCYCELTGLYWAWKHLDSDYIGLAHYRRHFRGRGRGDVWNRILKSEELLPQLGKTKLGEKLLKALSAEKAVLRHRDPVLPLCPHALHRAPGQDEADP